MILDAVLSALSEPTAIPLWGVVAFAAGMYPLGLMLGSTCSPCCTPCGCPVGEQLPEKISVEFSGVTQSAAKTGDLLAVAFESCFGSGASATVTAPGGLETAAGPITAATLTAGGSGYAVLGRVEPVGLTVGGGSGSGAEFGVTLAETVDGCGLPAWKVSAVTVEKSGDGYVDGEQLTVSLGADEYEQTPAVLVLLSTPSEPTLSATVVDGGSSGDAVLSVTTKLVSSNPDRWGVDTVSVVDGGSFYADESPVTFSPNGGGIQVSAASGVARTRRDAPTVFYDYHTGGGSGATFSVTLSKIVVGGNDFYEVSSVSVTSGGSGYGSGTVYFRISGPTSFEEEKAAYTITQSGGVITSLTKSNGGRYWKNSGVVERVTVTSPGSYYGPSTSAGSVSVVNGGLYYKEDPDIPAHVADVTVSITQTAPSNGAGAEISAVIDGDPGSATFGQITGLTLDAGGDDYLSWSYTVSDCCPSRLNGRTYLLERTSATSCEWTTNCCGNPSISVVYNGQGAPPVVITGGGGLGACQVTFFGDPADAPFACDPLSFTATDVLGGTATVAPLPSSSTRSEYPCPGCCDIPPGEEQLVCHDSESCLAAGGTWSDVCECGPCVGCTTEQSLIVTATVHWRYFNFATGVKQYAPPWQGSYVSGSADYTIELSAANGWEGSDQYVEPSCFGCTDGAGAKASLGNDEETDRCCVYATAWSDLMNTFVYNNGSIGGDTLWEFINTGTWKLPAYVACVRVPSHGGCFTGGASFSSEPSELDDYGYHVWLVIHVTVAS